MSGNPQNVRFSHAQDLFQNIPVLEEDVTARPNGEDVLTFIETLAAGDTPEEALTVCAYALEARHAVWWAHECLVRRKDLITPKDEEMLALAAAWVGDPSEEHRQAALVAASGEKRPTPGAWVAFGAGWSGGSINPPDGPEVPPGPELTPKALNVAVLTILASVEIDSREKTLASFVKMARQLTEPG